MNLGQFALTLGSTPFFATRLFGTTFLLALLAWAQQEGRLAFLKGGLLDVDLAFQLPGWMTHPVTLWALGILATLECLKEKNSEIRGLFETIDAPAKTFGSMVVNSGLTVQAGLALAQGDGPYLAAFGLQTLWVAVPAFLVWTFTRLRAAIFNFLGELDPDDDLGVQRILSWAEEGWVVSGVLFLVVLPAVALVLAGLTVVGLFVGDWYARRREESLKTPCPGCQTPLHASALECPSCRRQFAQPRKIGFWGQPKAAAVTDLRKHQLRLLAKKRCPACATRLHDQAIQQRCKGCRRTIFGSKEAAEAYLDDVGLRMPLTMLIATGLSAIPFVGIVPGIVYYRMSLLSAIRGYVPGSRTILLRWALRLTTVVCLAFQWIPGLGALSLPLICIIHYKAYRGAFVRECDRRLIEARA
ncbi:MAG: hypothetical protein GC160_28385 [Acidobacteria bacterium]|nr:hypothetical protein [Acidobacteriota bacterium]